jgi:hypothetical protein
MVEISMNRLEKKYPLKGFIDTHLHTAPDIRPRILDDIRAAKAASHEKMRAIIIKSHVEPTSRRAVIAQQTTGLKVFGGVCLNTCVGGVNFAAVKTAVCLGGKIIWLPTISRDKWNLKENWSVLEDIFHLMAEKDLVLATGHLQAEEIFPVLDLAGNCGLDKIMVNHPLTGVVGASIEEQKEISRQAYLEHCYVACLPRHDQMDPVKIVQSIKEVGAGKCIMATDLGQIHNPHPTEGLKDYIQKMLDLGITWKEIKLMCHRNPYRLFF